jgi:hypothetical protein
MVDNTTGGTVDIDNIYSPMSDARSYHTKSGSINEYEGGLAKLAQKCLAIAKFLAKLTPSNSSMVFAKANPMEVRIVSLNRQLKHSAQRGYQSGTHSP